MHDTQKTLTDLRDQLARHDKRIAFLFGAGTASAVRVASTGQKNEKEPLIPAVAPLTALCRNHANHLGEKYANAWSLIEAQCRENKLIPNVENILSRLRMMLNAVGGSDTLVGLKKDEIKTLEESVRKTIATVVTPDLRRIPEDSPHRKLARWLARTSRQNPVEIFTVNYDVLFEHAFEAERIPTFDGFVGSFRPFFHPDSLRRIETAPGPNWTRLWKMHGSVTWRRVDQDGRLRVVRGEPDPAGEMIYPSFQKYDESRQQPYTAFTDRLSRFLEQDDALLMVAGFSFGDEHINNLVFGALENRTRTHAYALQFDELAEESDLIKRAYQRPNLVVICPRTGVIGGRRAEWSPVEIPALMEDVFELIVAKPADAGQNAGEAEVKSGSMKIGDFASFCSFLQSMRANYLDMALTEPTYVGQVASVTGSIVRTRLREDMPSTLVMIAGESYRVGQIGGFFRIPLGYTNLYAVCTQIGADAAPPGSAEASFGPPLEESLQGRLSGYRWMTVVLFGEGLGVQFERDVGQYPTVGDEVHLVTNDDLKIIYGSTTTTKATISIGRIAAAFGISADVSVAGLVSRHSAIVGSTGAGKSNLVTVLLESLSDGTLPNARAIVIDPHGEYATALGDRAQLFRIRADEGLGERPLRVSFWALPFLELQHLTLGGLQPNHEAAIRDEVLDMKVAAARRLAIPPPLETLTADSPVPFSIRRLWYELDRFERITFRVNPQTEESAYDLEEEGNPTQLRPSRYPAASPYNQAPYKNQRKRNIERQLDLMRSRLKDSRFSFLFSPGGGYDPNLDGEIQSDLDDLVRDWVGHNKPATVFDLSGLPSEVLPTVVGTMLRVIYDMLFWAQDLPIGGRQQPLLVILDEAHRFLPEGGDTTAHRTLSTIAKEGRKYGTGLMLVTQRPSEIDSAVLSQCGSLIALRITNPADRGKVAAAVPDDLGGLVEQLPSLRTGEGIFLGEVMPIPSRVRVRKARNKPIGDNPKLPGVWQTANRPDGRLYSQALANWRAQSTSATIADEVIKGGADNA